MLLKFGRAVAPYEIYQMVHILMLLWQHSRFQSSFKEEEEEEESCFALQMSNVKCQMFKCSSQICLNI